MMFFTCLPSLLLGFQFFMMISCKLHFNRCTSQIVYKPAPGESSSRRKTPRLQPAERICHDGAQSPIVTALETTLDRFDESWGPHHLFCSHRAPTCLADPAQVPFGGCEPIPKRIGNGIQTRSLGQSGRGVRRSHSRNGPKPHGSALWKRDPFLPQRSSASIRPATD